MAGGHIHKDQDTEDGIHYPVSFSYANSGARTGATGFVATDVYKFAIQTDTNMVYMLASTTPTWIPIGLQGISGDLTVNSGGTATIVKGVGFFIASSFSTDIVVLPVANSGTISTVFASVTSAPTATCVINVLMGTTWTTMTTIFTDGTTALTIAATSGYLGTSSALAVTTAKSGYVIGILVVTPASGYNLGVTVRMT